MWPLLKLSNTLQEREFLGLRSRQQVQQRRHDWHDRDLFLALGHQVDVDAQLQSRETRAVNRRQVSSKTTNQNRMDQGFVALIKCRTSLEFDFLMTGGSHLALCLAHAVPCDF